MNPKKPDLVEEPDASYGKYSYADYLTWQFEEVVELINGKIFKKAAAAPKRIHQRVSVKLAAKLYQFLAETTEDRQKEVAKYTEAKEKEL